MSEKTKGIARVVLTALVLIVGGYFIQKSITDAGVSVNIADADIPSDPTPGGGK